MTSGMFSIPDAHLPYLEGTAFSNGLRMRISAPRWSVPDRLSFLEDYVRGMAVLHVGCTDHLPLIEEKRRKGRWAHDRLSKTAARLAGLDIDAEAVAYLTDTLRIPDIFLTDVLRDPIPPAIAASRWDVALLGEIVEHLDEPVSFLRTFREHYGSVVDRVLITVPNAFRADNARWSGQHLEINNSDHRTWWTPWTLAKVLTRAGYHAPRWTFCEGHPLPQWRLLRRAHLMTSPAHCDTLVMEARMGSEKYEV